MPLRVASGEQGVLVHPDEENAPAQLRQHLERALLERGVGVVREQRGDQACVVGRRLEVAGVDVELAGRAGGRSATSSGQLERVDEVAVVAQRDRAVGGGAERGLRVLPRAGAGRGVAAVADGQVALERGEGGLVEHLRDQAHVLVDQDLPPVADRDPGGLLPAVLQGVEAEVGQLGDVLAGRPDPEDATGVLRALVLGVECCGQSAVAAGAWPGGRGTFTSLRRGQDTHPASSPHESSSISARSARCA